MAMHPEAGGLDIEITPLPIRPQWLPKTAQSSLAIAAL